MRPLSFGIHKADHTGWRAVYIGTDEPGLRVRFGFWFAMSSAFGRRSFIRPPWPQDGWQIRLWRFALAVQFTD